jgi:hypothetical protein
MSSEMENDRKKDDAWLDKEAASLEKYLSTSTSENTAQWPYREVVMWELVLSNLILGNG